MAGRPALGPDPPGPGAPTPQASRGCSANTSITFFYTSALHAMGRAIKVSRPGQRFLHGATLAATPPYCRNSYQKYLHHFSTSATAAVNFF